MAANPFLIELGRGVYNAPFRGLNGEHVMFSVTHDHRRLAEALVTSDGNLDAIRRTLQAELDREDPVVGFNRFIGTLLRS